VKVTPTTTWSRLSLTLAPDAALRIDENYYVLSKRVP
jgi:hypothetical protein